ncbi:hypothetical protein J6590_010790 [Homalodisca vitripennis]|nr:hypothetical protein J6590_010790 [Homalodisca vitripennis]
MPLNTKRHNQNVWKKLDLLNDPLPPKHSAFRHPRDLCPSPLSIPECRKRLIFRFSANTTPRLAKNLAFSEGIENIRISKNFMTPPDATLRQHPFRINIRRALAGGQSVLTAVICCFGRAKLKLSQTITLLVLINFTTFGI